MAIQYNDNDNILIYIWLPSRMDEFVVACNEVSVDGMASKDVEIVDVCFSVLPMLVDVT